MGAEEFKAEFDIDELTGGEAAGTEVASMDDEGGTELQEEQVADADEIVVDVVDDTPEQDRGREPLPENIVQELEEDDAEEYSHKVKQRIKQMKKAWHDERRAKEAALRERMAAAEVTKNLMSELNQVKQELQHGEGWALANAKRAAQLEMDVAKQAYKAAYESGDADALAEAQQRFTTATNNFERANALTPRYQGLQDENNDYNAAIQSQIQVTPAQQAPDDANVRLAEQWASKNPWYGNNHELTGYARGVNDALLQAGEDPTSQDFYDKLDTKLRDKFPEAFGVQRKPAKRKAQVVASSGRATKGKRVTLTRSELKIAEELGVTPEQYALHKTSGSVIL